MLHPLATCSAECCAAVLLTKALRQVDGGIMVLLVQLWFLKVLVRIEGMIYSIPAGSQISPLLMLFYSLVLFEWVLTVVSSPASNSV